MSNYQNYLEDSLRWIAGPCPQAFCFNGFGVELKMRISNKVPSTVGAGGKGDGLPGLPLRPITYV